MPSALSATAVSSSRINVTWGSSAGATSYQLRYKTGDGNYGNPMNMMAKMAYLHTGLSAATEYTYQVRAVNVNGHSDWSAGESETTVAATTAAGRLGVPTGLTVVDATTTATPGLKITWNAVAKATGYELRNWVVATSTWDLVTLTPEQQTARSITIDSGLTDGTTYYYIVAALDNNGTDVDDDDDMSDWSAPQSGMTDAVKPMDVPTNLMATPRGENRIWVSWMGVGVTEYVLQSRRKGTSAWSTINVQGRMTHAHTGLSAGMQYQYRIAAKNSGGMSGWSKEVKGTTWSKQLGTPTGLMAVDATTSEGAAIKLTWTAVSGATGYEIQKWEVVTDGTRNAWRDLAGNDGVTMAESGMTSDTDTAVMEDMTYYYIVRATSGDVKSPWTGAMSGMTKATAPLAPTLVLVSTGQTMVRLSWAASSGDTTSKTGWNVQYAEGSVDAGQFDDAERSKMEMSLNAMPMHYIQRNLKPGTRYSFRIQGTLPLGVKSKFSDVGEIITKPANPTLMASSATSTSINLTWTIVTPDGLAPADGGTNFDCADYEIQRRKTGEGMWVNVDDAKTVNPAGDKCSIIDDGAADTPLDSNKLYYYRLRVAVAVADHLPPTIKSYWDQATARTTSQ